MTQTQTQGKLNVTDDYQAYTDKYFLRSRQILATENINPIVRYQVFSRGEGIVNGVDEAVDFVKGIVGRRAKIFALRDGQDFQPLETLMVIEGRVQNLVELETVYLGIISGGLTGEIDLREIRRNAEAIVQAAEEKQVIYFGARHFHPSLDREIAQQCHDAGFVGTSTDVGAEAWQVQGLGTIPHALILSYEAYMHENNIAGNSTAEAARAFDEYIDPHVPRIVLIDTFNREFEDTLASYERAARMDGIRVDTCGENYIQTGQMQFKMPELDVPEKYLTGTSVKIQGVWGLRKSLMDIGLGHLDLVVSSGFNAKKTAAFMKADRAFQNKYDIPLFTSIGTGSIAKPVMTTSDIVSYFSEKQQKWLPNVKNGRRYNENPRLEVR